MNGMRTVLGFTYRDQVRKKSYIISTIVILVLIIAAMCIPAAINAYQDSKKGGSGSSTGSETAKGTLYLVDKTSAGLFADAGILEKAFPSYKTESASASQTQELLDKIKTDSKTALAVVTDSDGALKFDYYVKSEGSGPDPDALSTALKNVYAAGTLSAGGVPAATIGRVLAPVSYQVHAQGKGMLSGFIPAIAVSLLLFMCIYMYGYWVAMSIASEKTSRVMELLITSTKPSKIVIGKSIAMGLLGLQQLLAIIAVSVGTYKLAYPKNFSLGGLTINFSGFTPYYAVMLLVYFVLGFALYAMISAVAGATVSNAEDVRTAITPVSLVAVISFYFAYLTIMVPETPAAAAASMVPFSAPFSMPSRILTTDVPGWQIAVSFTLLAGVTALMAWVSIRLYSAAVLHYGKRLRIGDLVKMSRG